MTTWGREAPAAACPRAPPLLHKWGRGWHALVQGSAVKGEGEGPVATGRGVGCPSPWRGWGLSCPVQGSLAKGGGEGNVSLCAPLPCKWGADRGEGRTQEARWWQALCATDLSVKWAAVVNAGRGDGKGGTQGRGVHKGTRPLSPSLPASPLPPLAAPPCMCGKGAHKGTPPPAPPFPFMRKGGARGHTTPSTSLPPWLCHLIYMGRGMRDTPSPPVPPLPPSTTLPCTCRKGVHKAMQHATPPFPFVWRKGRAQGAQHPLPLGHATLYMQTGGM
ncbi:hypothetical protein EDB85DRAFT_1889376 [Lactarius pseudohatsudake]|nr:hypothetical protein EDB85DRAFT_1889376 [Lactarius pseudohatsudake]